jgi:hypothetical protein
MPPVPQIFVSVDSSNQTYSFTTNPSGNPLVVLYGGSFSIVATGRETDITVVATLPSTATVTTPFTPALATVTTTQETYQLDAIGMVTLSVPTYNGVNLTGTPLVLAPFVSLTLSESGNQSPEVSFGAQVNLLTGLQMQTTGYTYSGLFVGEDGSVPIGPGSSGSIYTIADVDENAYPISTEQNAKAIPLIAVINVSSTKKPKA